MELNATIIIIANTIISFLFFYLLKNYLPSYFNEKGKNLATKEDVGKITEIVEMIKLSNGKELEKIKTELNLVSKTQQVIYDDERKAIIEFLGVISTFYSMNTDIPNESSSLEGITFIEMRMREIEKEYGRIMVAKSKLELFCTYDKIIEAAEPITKDLIYIHGQTQIFNQKILGNKKLAVLIEKNNLAAPSDKGFERYKEESEKGLAIFKEFLEVKKDFSKTYKPQYNIFQNICKEYLLSISALKGNETHKVIMQ